MIECLLSMEDLRIRRTKQNIENAMLEAIEVKGFANVRIVDIAKMAMVNRNTIYLHYGSKEGIVASIVDRAFKENWDDADVDNLLTARLNRQKVYKMFVRLFTILQENIELYRIILTDPSLSGYLDKKVVQIKTAIFSNMKSTKRNDIGIEYVVNGVYGAICKWIIYDIGTIEENAKIISEFTYANVRHLLLTR